jgi:hypothetical protein
LNVGVILYDPERHRIYPAFDAAPAARRIARLFPEVDQRGLAELMISLGRGLSTDTRVLEALKEGNIFNTLSGEWQNVIQFTPPRPFPGVDAVSAVQRLLHIYVVARNRRAHSTNLSGASKAKTITREAIERYIDPIGGMLVREEVEIPRILPHSNVSLPIRLPFVVVDRFGIDALALDAESGESLQRETENFIGKVFELRRVRQELSPHAAVSVDPERPERARALIDYILFKTRLPDYAVVEADPEKVTSMVTEIRDRLQTTV